MKNLEPFLQLTSPYNSSLRDILHSPKEKLESTLLLFRFLHLRSFLALFTCILLLAACQPSSPYRRTVSNIFNDAKKERSVFVKHFSNTVDPQALNVLQANLKKQKSPKFEQDGPKCVRAYWGSSVIKGSVYFYFKTGDPTIIEAFESGGGISESVANLRRHNPRSKTPNQTDSCRIENGLPPSN